MSIVYAFPGGYARAVNNEQGTGKTGLPAAKANKAKKERKSALYIAFFAANLRFDFAFAVKFFLF
jgi:hypothetical protein